MHSAKRLDDPFVVTNIAYPNVTMGDKFEDFALACLRAHVKWHLETDDTPLSPTLDGTHGKFMNLPFQVWLACDQSRFQIDFDEWSLFSYKPSSVILSCLGAQLMTERMKQRLTGSSPPDILLPPIPFTRGRCRYGVEYLQVRKSEEERLCESFERASYKGMIACLVQWYMEQYLGRGNELVTTFFNPAAAINVPDHLKLAIGVFREFLVYPRFGCMRNFWLAHARLIEDGGKSIGFWKKGEARGVSRVREVLREDQEALSMLDMLLDLGLIEGKAFSREYSMIGVEFQFE